MYMLDTNVIIYAIRHPDAKLHDRIRNHLGKDLCISVITYGELAYGIRKSSRPEQNRTAVQSFLAGIRIVEFDMPAAEHFGDIIADLESKRQRIGDRDMLIAAHARSRGDTVVTNNLCEFSRVNGLSVEDWFETV